VPANSPTDELTVTAPATEPLSAAMRTGSRHAHAAAEAVPFIRSLLAGQVSGAGYRAYLLRLQGVYRTLEEQLRRCRAHPAVAAVWDPALERGRALEADLRFWSDGDPTAPSDSPALAAYRRRLLAATEEPELLVAHHYTRYLGDLAGGQAIGRVLRRVYALDGPGLAFYDFPLVPQPVPYRRAYRDRLDALPLTPGQQLRVVSEVQDAFALNTALFAELG
jgi:heme oxygenase